MDLTKSFFGVPLVDSYPKVYKHQQRHLNHTFGVGRYEGLFKVVLTDVACQMDPRS